MDKKILLRYILGDASPDEIEEVVDWLDADESHVKEFMDLHKLHNISLFNPPALDQAQNANRNRVNTAKKIGRILIRVAAIFLFIAIGVKVSDMFQLTGSQANNTLLIPAGQRAELILPDSTKVWVNAGTKLVYPSQFSKEKREVYLDGEAYFEVKHDKNSPFIVKTKDLDVEVLGTEFNVTSYSNYSYTEVSLVKGRVNLKPLNHPDYIMNVNEHIRYEKGNLLSTKTLDDVDFSWRNGILYFKNETVQNIFKKLELIYDVKIVTQNEELSKNRYSGKFRMADGIDQVLKVLQLEHHFSYNKNDDLKIITIK